MLLLFRDPKTDILWNGEMRLPVSCHLMLYFHFNGLKIMLTKITVARFKCSLDQVKKCPDAFNLGI